MKKILVLCLLKLTLFGANIDKYATEMGFERDYKSALAKAKAVNKPLMIVLGADYCLGVVSLREIHSHQNLYSQLSKKVCHTYSR